MNTSDKYYIRPVVMCGGSGTRLWPLSRESCPKQFVPLLPEGEGRVSLLHATLDRIRPFAEKGGLLCVSNEEHRFLVQEAMESAGTPGSQLLEPVGRNTAAVMACAALSSQPSDLLLALPADHYIRDKTRFIELVNSACEVAADGYLVTFGVQPDAPSTAYGYIQRGEALDANAFNVSRFVEKPPREQAESMLATGVYYWNAGIFLARCDAVIEALERHAPDILEACRGAVARQTRDGSFVRLAHDAFEACRSQSFDYAVMERHDRVAMVPLPLVWSDVGSWAALATLLSPDSAGNRIVGRGHTFDSRDTYISAPHRPVVAVGVDGLTIVDTQDALLVLRSDQSEHVKDAVAHLKSEGVSEAVTHRRVARPWGSYDCVDAGDRFQVKRLVVKPGAKLSLQLHHHRAEHWVVVRGTAKVTRGDQIMMLSENESVYIPLGMAHRLENPGKVPLEVIEVQSGGYLGEDDIVRIEDTYGRVETK